MADPTWLSPQTTKAAVRMARSDEVLTFGELDQGSNQIAHLFRILGIAAADHIALLMDNQTRCFAVCWAAQRSGLFYTAISTRLRPVEVAYIVHDYGAERAATRGDRLVVCRGRCRLRRNARSGRS